MILLGTLQMLLLAGLLCSLVAGVACSFVVSAVVRWTGAWAPASRHRALVLVAIAPLTLGAAALMSVMLPSLLGMVWPGYDHCLKHGGHSHLCFVHASPHLGGWAGWSLIAAAGAWLIARLAVGARELLRATQIVRELTRCARYDAARSLWIVPSDDTVCLSVGLLQPKLVTSDGLLAKASSDEIEIMVAHEEAHARRKDNLVRLVGRVVSMLLLPRARARLLATLELAAEQACDEHAVLRAGDRLRVAETILAVERRLVAAAGIHRSPLIAGFGSSAVPERVEAMLEPAREAGALSRLAAVLLGLVVLLLGAHDSLHHTTESLLAFFSH